MKITFETLLARITAIRASEAITKAELSKFSREALVLLLENKDVRAINALLGVAEDGKAVLSPMNRKTAGLFFKHFVAFSVAQEDTLVQFGKLKAKQWDAKEKEITEWLSDEKNDIWKWASDNIQVEAKPVAYAERVTKTIKEALEGKKGDAISQVDVLKAVLSGGVSVDALIQLVTAIGEQQKAA